MKTLFTIITCLFINFSWSQTIDSIDFNNSNGMIISSGQLFSNPLSFPAYGIKSDGGAKGIYSSFFWFAGLDDNDSLHTCITGYSNSDLKTGPIANDYTNSYYINRYDNKIWSVTEQEIIYHISNYQNNFYNIPNSILNWPAHGETLNGEAQNLAPYEDINNNGVYDPQNGDYPKIRGQKAVYLIYNDDNSTDTNKLGLEYHLMYYQFASSDCINNTTFINLTIYNRSNTNYHNFKVAQHNDFDIGGATDDFVGCDSTRNLIYGYNGDPIDDAGTSLKYGANPPAFGVKQLNQPMEVAIYYNVNSGYAGIPYTPNDYWNYMNAKWKDGTHFTYGGYGYNGSISTNYIFSGNPYTQTGWTEASANHLPNDKRMVTCTGGGTLGSGQTVCIDYAIIYSRSGGDYLANVNTLFNVADSVQTFYDGLPYSCPAGSIVLNTEELASYNTFSVYPNPNNGSFTINFDGKYNLIVYSINGELMTSKNNLSYQSNINLDLTSGLYIIQVEQNGKMYYNKMVVE